ncbi:TetR/AcrR family transcriptional regulator [Cohnella pontilimi]|uniref:TetR/AcrR family transcriptional regulator n=1 Tax=Cohnella pontilimi TaxID=2564100 RepID=A0A4U0FBB5_9BACL|nr:TetR/AcrR family transcriptional regulator [Cohnella pontilimi]TJY41987.1 TetR/AcrR family transcriptional regulator [Cohnella pontilimi]
MEGDIEAKLPRGVAMSWGLVKQPQRGPKREMSIEQIVDTAVSIADKEGLSAVSMNRVAASLGFTTMSLYRYIPSKDDLLLLMQEAVSYIDLPDKAENWRDNLRTYVRITMPVFREHPWFGDIPISGVPLTPNNLRMVDWVLGAMAGLRLHDSEKMSIILLLSSYARATGMLARDMERAIRAGSSPEAFSGTDYSTALKQLVTKDRFPNLHPVMMSGAYTGENEADHTVDNDFDFGLERILDGIEHYLSSK